MGHFRDRRVYEIGLIAIRDVSPPLFCAAMEYYCESLEIDSEGRIVEVVLDTEFSDIRTGDNKTRPKNWCWQFARKVGPSSNSVRYSSLSFDSLGRLATASERTASA